MSCVLGHNNRREPSEEDIDFHDIMTHIFVVPPVNKIRGKMEIVTEPAEIKGDS